MQSKKLHKFRFRERLAVALKDRGVTQQQLAEATGVSQAAISNYLRGVRTMPGVEELVSLSSYFQVSLEWLLGLTEVAEGGGSSPHAPAADAPVPLDRRKLRVVAKQLRQQVERLDQLCGSGEQQQPAKED